MAYSDTGAADNSGAANYVGRDSGLVYTDGEGNAVIAVDTTESVGLRNSIRMVSNEQLDVGEFNYDFMSHTRFNRLDRIYDDR